MKKIIIIFVTSLLILLGVYFIYKKYEEKKWSDCMDWLFSFDVDKMPHVEPGHKCFNDWRNLNSILDNNDSDNNTSIDEKSGSITLKGFDLKSYSLSKVDINGDNQDEIINFSKSASWFNNVFIISPKDDGTFSLFCKHCHFIFNGGTQKIEFNDLNDDGKIEINISTVLDNKVISSETFIYSNNDYIKMDNK